MVSSARILGTLCSAINSDVTRSLIDIVLYLHAQHLQQIEAHAERVYPNECCGLMLGCTVGEDKQILEIWETENAWNDETAIEFNADANLETAERRYTIAPEVMLAAQKTSRDRGWQILGIYHSHPDHPAVPSDVDRAWAWSHYSYLIISVCEGQSIECRSWQLDENHQFQPESIVLRNAGEIEIGDLDTTPQT
ncbi:MAG: M67 family metallopeptidase [Cyanobacteria bacterium SID2]|nr:M67 family metallopeptidase [Cyanobacteria bacterium SID2]MBP0003666.1 M67 family metallopeptidase [Cyanobacteria bacterium SBC]